MRRRVGVDLPPLVGGRQAGARVVKLGLALKEQRPMKPSLRKVYAMLREAGPDGVTTRQFMRAYVERFSARLHELRRLGVTIGRQRVDDSQWRYWIEG